MEIDIQKLKQDGENGDIAACRMLSDYFLKEKDFKSASLWNLKTQDLIQLNIVFSEVKNKEYAAAQTSVSEIKDNRIGAIYQTKLNKIQELLKLLEDLKELPKVDLGDTFLEELNNFSKGTEKIETSFLEIKNRFNTIQKDYENIESAIQNSLTEYSQNKKNNFPTEIKEQCVFFQNEYNKISQNYFTNNDSNLITQIKPIKDSLEIIESVFDFIKTKIVNADAPEIDLETWIELFNENKNTLADEKQIDRIENKYKTQLGIKKIEISTPDESHKNKISHNRYKTCFHITNGSATKNPLNATKDLLTDIQECIWKWVLKHEKEDWYKQSIDAFTFNSNDDIFKRFIGNKENNEDEFYFKSKSELNSHLTSSYFDYNDTTLWFMHYSHDDKKVKGYRWNVEIGLRYSKEQDDILVSINNSIDVLTNIALTGKKDINLDNLQDPPRIVKDIFSIPNRIKTISNSKKENGATIIYGCQTASIKDDLEKIKAEIFNPRRSYPWIIVRGYPNNSIEKIAQFLVGKALVLCLPEKVYSNFETLITEEWGVKKEQLRIYFPIRAREPEFHPSFNIKDLNIDYAKQLGEVKNATVKNIVNTIFMYNNVDSKDLSIAIDNEKTFERVKRELKIRSKIKENQESNSDIEILYNMLSDKEKEIDEKKKESAEISKIFDENETNHKKEKEKLSTKIREQNTEIAKLKGKINEQKTNISNIFFESLSSLPKTVEDVIGVLRPYLNNVIFTPDCDEEPKGIVKKDINSIWEALIAINNHLAGMFNKGGIDIEKEFKNKTGYEYAKTNGNQTKTNNELRRSFIEEYNGEKYDTMPHIKVNRDIRIYLAQGKNKEKGKVLIFHIGPHREIGSSKKRK